MCPYSRKQSTSSTSLSPSGGLKRLLIRTERRTAHGLQDTNNQKLYKGVIDKLFQSSVQRKRSTTQSSEQTQTSMLLSPRYLKLVDFKLF